MFRDTGDDYVRGNLEALEDDDNIIEDEIEDEAKNEDDVEGDDLIDDMEQDYELRPELDVYENDGLDDQMGSQGPRELSMGERAAIDKQLQQEDRIRQQLAGRRAGAFLQDEEEDDEEMHIQMRQERMRLMREGQPDEPSSSNDM